MKKMDKKQKKTTAERISQLKEIWEQISVWAVEHKKILMPAALVVFVAITVMIAVNANKQGNTASDDAEKVSAESVTMELDAHPEVNTLIDSYYGALSTGDAQLATTMNPDLTQTEKIYITEMGKMIDSFTSIEVYTKPGPIENSYLAYVYYEVKFIGTEVAGPGMSAYYICCNEDGAYYINEGNESEDVTSYIEEMSLQDDVVDLNNRVSVAFNDLMANDAEYQQFYSDLITQLDITVGEELAKAEETASGDETPVQELTTEEPEAPAETIVTKVQTTDVVNIRSSASETADKLGKAQTGDIFDVVKVWENGWTQIKYDNGEGFIKTDYLSVVEETATGSNETTTTTIGTVTALDTVNVRATASENGEKLGVIYEGESLDLLAKQTDGWSKVKYKDQIGYVKSEYVK